MRVRLLMILRIRKSRLRFKTVVSGIVLIEQSMVLGILAILILAVIIGASSAAVSVRQMRAERQLETLAEAGRQYYAYHKHWPRLVDDICPYLNSCSVDSSVVFEDRGAYGQITVGTQTLSVYPITTITGYLTYERQK